MRHLARRIDGPAAGGLWCKIRRTAPALLVAALALLVNTGEGWAGDGADGGAKTASKKATPKKAPAKATLPKGPSLAFRPTYADALLEARIRNLPVFVSRHKDF